MKVKTNYEREQKLIFRLPWTSDPGHKKSKINHTSLQSKYRTR